MRLSPSRFIVAALLLVATVAYAEPERPWAVGIPPARQTEALRLFKVGNGKFVEAHHADALATYRTALALWDHPSIRYNIAVCYIHLDQPLQAFQNLEVALRYGESALGAEVHQQALTYKKLLLGQLASLRVRTKEPGADISLDGERLFVGPGAAERLVVPGVHQLVAQKHGFLTFTQSPTLLPGKQTELDVRLIALGTLTKTARRWPSWKPWVVFGAGALVAVLGVPLYLDGHANNGAFRNEVDTNPSCGSGCDPSILPQIARDLQSRGTAEEISGFTLFAVGGAVALTGVVLLIVNQPRVVTADRGMLAFRF